jgi:GGDEF domain-containing protein
LTSGADLAATSQLPALSVSVAKPISVVFSPHNRPLPDAVSDWVAGLKLPIVRVVDADQLMSIALRGRPRVVAFDARHDAERVWDGCQRLKADSYTGIVPCIIVVESDREDFKAAFDAGADEVVRPSDNRDETITRLDALLRRSDRDLTVHPSTRLPGAVEIEAEVQKRLAAGDLFAMCYADLDHFKEFNDRYSYYDGDRVIRILAKILHDVVKGVCAETGFVGHIGGDDFIFVIPVGFVNDVCGEIVSVFDTLIPFQYSEQDRRAGYFFGKDRRGQLHRVPLMTVSIGVVTNERRHFTHAAQVSELATEMKSYAKTLPGSVFSIDRRTDATANEIEHSAARVGAVGATGAGPGGGGSVGGREGGKRGGEEQ